MSRREKGEGGVAGSLFENKKTIRVVRTLSPTFKPGNREGVERENCESL